LFGAQKKHPFSDPYVRVFFLVSNAQAMGPEHTGFWYNSGQSGHGFSIEAHSHVNEPEEDFTHAEFL